MQRRTSVALPFLTGPALITAAKGQAPLPRLGQGQGQHFYEASHDFLRPPPTLKFGNTHGIVVTGDGRILLCLTVHKSSDSAGAFRLQMPIGSMLAIESDRWVSLSCSLTRFTFSY